MYTFYIKNYLDQTVNPGRLITTESVVYSVPITELQGDSLMPFSDPTVKQEMGKTGSMEASLSPVHPLYNSLLQMKTIMRVDYDGTNIFRGRVLTIDVSPLAGDKKVHLEGDLAFLMDSIQEGTKEVFRNETSVTTYIQSLIAEHNRQMQESGETDKMFAVGEIPGHYSASIHSEQRVVVSETKKFGSEGWQTTMSALEALSKEYGGYFRTRYVSGTCYLDWLEYCFNYNINSQPIEIGENLIDIRGTTEVENIFTALVPIGRNTKKSSGNEDSNVYIDGYREDIHGANKRILVPQIVSLFTDAELNRRYHSKADYQNAVNNYGIIYKNQSFPNADTKEKLWEYAIDWIKENYIGGITSFDLTALDMHHLDSNALKYLVGDRVRVTYPDMSRHTASGTPTITKELTITSVQYYPHNPEKNQYNMGIPNSIISKTYGTASGSNGSGSGGISHSNNTHSQSDWEDEIRRLSLEQEAADHIISASYNSEDWKAIEQLDPDRSSSIIQSSEIKLFRHLDTLESETVIKDQDGNDVVIPQGVKGTLTSFVLDGERALFKIFDPVVKFINGKELTDGTVVDYDAYYNNEVGAGLVFDGYNRSLEIRDIPNWRQAGNQVLDVMTKPFQWITGSTLKFTHLDSSEEGQGGATKIETGVPILDPSGSAISSFVTSTTDGQTGLLGAIKQKLGLDGTGDKATIFQDGIESLTSHFDPTTVGKQGVTPDKTAETNGKEGSMAAGSGGDLNGWKITLNKPLTYKATIDGVQKTFTVNPGMVAADDMHFTKKYDSIYAELAVFDQMYADYAQIGTLVAMKATIDEIESKYVSTEYLNAGFTISGGITAGSITSTGTIDATGAISASDFKFRSNAASLGKGIKTLASSSDSSGNITLTPTLLDGTTGTPVTFSIAATLSGAYGGDNTGAVATYTVTGSPSKNFPSGNTSLGTLTLKINKNAAWVEDPTGAIRARVDNTYAGDTDAAYKRGWNECIDSCSGGYYLDDYETYMNGTKVALYVAPTGGAQKATGEDQVWRYGGSRAYRYTIPAKK